MCRSDFNQKLNYFSGILLKDSVERFKCGYNHLHYIFSFGPKSHNKMLLSVLKAFD